MYSHMHYHLPSTMTPGVLVRSEEEEEEAMESDFIDCFQWESLRKQYPDPVNIC